MGPRPEPALLAREIVGPASTNPPARRAAITGALNRAARGLVEAEPKWLVLICPSSAVRPGEG
jgi:hypothetical protein